MRYAIFPASAIGYVDYPEALFTRGLASGLIARGAEVRVVEERRNPALRRTLETVGAGASRQVYESFPRLPIHTYEPRTGAPLMEWLSRELSLVDAGIAINGLPEETTRWLANINHPELVRIYLTFRPDELTAEQVSALEIEKFDLVLATSQPAAPDLAWLPIKPSVAAQDRESGLVDAVPDPLRELLDDPVEVASELERLIFVRKLRA